MNTTIDTIKRNKNMANSFSLLLITCFRGNRSIYKRARNKAGPRPKELVLSWCIIFLRIDIFITSKLALVAS